MLIGSSYLLELTLWLALMCIVLEIEEQKVVEENVEDSIMLSGLLGMFHLCHIATWQLVSKPHTLVSICEIGITGLSLG